MTNVVTLHPKEDEEPQVWTCGNCGSQDFMLYSDGSTECSMCESRDDSVRGGWVERLEPDPEFDEDITPRQLVHHSTPSFARNAVMRGVDDDACAVVVIWPTGRVKAWSIFDQHDSDERKAWYYAQLRVAGSLAFGVKDDAGVLPGHDEDPPGAA